MLRARVDKVEVDILIPSINLAIEVDGIYWHGELNNKTKNYHLNKTNHCKKHGIRLIHITDAEWILKKPIVKSRILSLLQKAPHVIYARKCTLKELSYEQKHSFFKQNHIQGDATSSINIGLFHKDELVAAMSFCKARYNKKFQYELSRFACKINHSIPGAAGKLFQYFVKQYSPTSIISYSDKRWNTGNVYNKLGFTYEKSSAPNYWYFSKENTLHLLSRVQFQKHKLRTVLTNYNENLTEWENMKNNGYDRYWDCGNDVWIWQQQLVSLKKS